MIIQEIKKTLEELCKDSLEIGDRIRKEITAL